MDQPLLVRAAEPADRRAAAELVRAAGWSAEQCRAWRDGAPAIVLYDPADTSVHGVVVARPRGPGVFDVVAWAVAPPLDRRTAAARLVGAIANRARRDGGERLIVSVVDENAGALLEACGFQKVSPVAGAPQQEIVLTYHLEL